MPSKAADPYCIEWERTWTFASSQRTNSPSRQIERCRGQRVHGVRQLEGGLLDRTYRAIPLRREQGCWLLLCCSLLHHARGGAGRDHRGARRGHSAPVATRLHASSQRVPDSVVRQSGSAPLSRGYARGPLRRAPAPHGHGALAWPAARHRHASRPPRAREQPARSKCARPRLGAAVRQTPPSVGHGLAGCCSLFGPEVRDAYQEAGVSRRRSRWRVAPRRGGRASQPYTEFGTRRLRACKRLRRRRRDTPADKTAIPIVRCSEPAPSPALRLRRRRTAGRCRRDIVVHPPLLRHRLLPRPRLA